MNIILIDDIEIINNEFETTNLKSINYFDRKNINVELNNNNYINLLKTFSKFNKKIFDLEKKYNNDIGKLLLCIKPKYINTINLLI